MFYGAVLHETGYKIPTVGKRKREREGGEGEPELWEKIVGGDEIRRKTSIKKNIAVSLFLFSVARKGTNKYRKKGTTKYFVFPCSIECI